MTFKTVFSAEYQMSHYKEPVYQIFADSRLEASLTKGQTIARSFASDVDVNDMAGDGGYDPQAVTDTQETLVINYEKETSIYVKKLDELQAHLPIKQKYGQKLANALINQIDADVLLQLHLGAGTVMDDGTFAGTAGDGHVATSANIALVFTTAMQRLRLKNVVYHKRFSSKMKLEVPEGMPAAAITPEILGFIEIYLGGKNTLLGDQVSRNGYSGYFMGFETFTSNALPFNSVLAMATQPVSGTTATINGVVITFRDTLTAPTGASEVHIASTVDITRANLAAFLNAGGRTSVTEATDAGASSATRANQRLLRNFVAVNDNAADTMTLQGAGKGTVALSTTVGSGIWTVARQRVNCIFALARSCSLVIQKDPSLEENAVSRKIGKDYIAWTVYGIKIFTDQAPQIVSYATASSAFGVSEPLSR